MKPIQPVELWYVYSIIFGSFIIRCWASNENEITTTSVIQYKNSPEQVSNPKTLFGQDIYDTAAYICDDCSSHISTIGSGVHWTHVKVILSSNSVDGTDIEREFEEVYSSFTVPLTLTTRNPLFLFQSPCTVRKPTGQNEIQLAQIVCNSKQNFSCEANHAKYGSEIKKQSQNSCHRKDVCWNFNLDHPTAGCLPGPNTGSYFAGMINTGSRIINGRDAQIGDHPWAVSLHMTLEGLLADCGASIIGTNLILTARHCFAKTMGYNLHLSMGKTVRGNGRVAIQSRSKYNLIFHPNKFVDLCLVKLKDEIEFTDRISPIALPENSSQFPKGREWATAIGWGIICSDPPECKIERETSVILQSVKIKVNPNRERCVGRWPDVPQQKKDFTFCAGGMTQHMGEKMAKDACEGDSGGALECTHGGKTYLCGVISIGPNPPDCGKSSGGYVMTWHKEILPWIEMQLRQQKNWTGGLENRGMSDDMTGQRGLPTNDQEEGKPGRSFCALIWTMHRSLILTIILNQVALAAFKLFM